MLLLLDSYASVPSGLGYRSKNMRAKTFLSAKARFRYSEILTCLSLKTGTFIVQENLFIESKKSQQICWKRFKNQCKINVF